MTRLSDPSGQFGRTVFDDDVAQLVEQAAKAGECVLLGVELDRKPGEEAPRVTIRSVTGFDALSRPHPPCQLEIDGDEPARSRRSAAAREPAAAASAQSGLKVHHGRGEAELVLGRDFLRRRRAGRAGRRIVGVTRSASAEAKPQLQLVS
jgi:DNA polymerase-3 subunit alpha